MHTVYESLGNELFSIAVTLQLKLTIAKSISQLANFALNENSTMLKMQKYLKKEKPLIQAKKSWMNVLLL